MKTIEVKEGQRAHFECKIIPVSDPTLKVEWFHNGQPLKQGKHKTSLLNCPVGFKSQLLFFFQILILIVLMY